jgi:hypothetical protein
MWIDIRLLFTYYLDKHKLILLVFYILNFYHLYFILYNSNVVNVLQDS